MAESILLPDDVKPTKYTLTLQPNLDTFEFKGVVDIDLVVLRPTSLLKFHSEDLTISDVSVSATDTLLSKSEGHLSVETQKEDGTASVLLGSHVLQAGQAKLHLEFSGILNDNMVGFYRAAYTKDGVKKYMATTQFEATEARKALPCWDEPALKATFEVTLVVPKDLTALSNMPEKSRSDAGDGLLAVSFAETPIMSTYLLAFIVGDLEKIGGHTKDGVAVNVYTTPGNIQGGKFALQVAIDLISFFTDYFGIAYPLPKADLVAVPSFAMGAMENWGLITFRDTTLLVDEATSSASACQHVAYVVSHELAHQWFGNLVTMKWWNDLWLNEGFATWVGWLGVDHVHPEWDVWTQFVNTDLGSALTTDALLGSHPIEVPIRDPKEIKQVFDALSYRKGASVIRQLDAAVSPAVFKQGLKAYLQRHQYGNTVTGDLWNAVHEASSQPIESMMRSWTQQIGFPLVTLATIPGSTNLHVRQNRFLSKGPPTAEEDSQLWWIPLTAVVGPTPEGGSTELPAVILSEKELAVSGLTVPDGGWIKLNAGQRGFYRVNYSQDLWGLLGGAVQNGQLAVTDRLGILMDAFALAKSGIIPTSQALQLATSFTAESEYTVWSQLSSEWGEIASLLSSTDLNESFEALGRSLFLPIAQKVGWNPQQGESHLTAMLRPLVLSRLGNFEHLPTIEEAKKRFSALLSTGQPIPGDLRRLVYSLAVKYGGQEEYQAVKELYREADQVDVKQDCLLALGQTREASLIRDFLQFGLDENEVKAQNVLYVFAVLSGNKAGRDIQWDFVKENWAKIYGRFYQTSGLVQHVVCLPLRGFHSFEKAEEAEEFFEANPVPEARMELLRTLEAIRARAAWIQRDLSDISQWLAKTAVTE